MNEQMKAGTQPPPKERDRENRRVGLDDIDGDFLTHGEFMIWSGLSRNGAYEVLRQDPFRQAVRRFGRQIRISKKALVRIVDGAS